MDEPMTSNGARRFTMSSGTDMSLTHGVGPLIQLDLQLDRSSRGARRRRHGNTAGLLLALYGSVQPGELGIRGSDQTTESSSRISSVLGIDRRPMPYCQSLPSVSTTNRSAGLRPLANRKIAPSEEFCGPGAKRSISRGNSRRWTSV